MDETTTLTTMDGNGITTVPEPARRVLKVDGMTAHLQVSARFLMFDDGQREAPDADTDEITATLELNDGGRIIFQKHHRKALGVDGRKAIISLTAEVLGRHGTDDETATQQEELINAD